MIFYFTYSSSFLFLERKLERRPFSSSAGTRDALPVHVTALPCRRLRSQNLLQRRQRRLG